MISQQKQHAYTGAWVPTLSQEKTSVQQQGLHDSKSPVPCCGFLKWGYSKDGWFKIGDINPQ